MCCLDSLNLSRLSSRPSSTCHTRTRELHRPARRRVRCRAGLPCPDPARLPHLHQHQLRRQEPTALGPRPARCRARRAHLSHPHQQLRRLRRPQGWQHLLREGHQVARCTVERRMRALGMQGARRGRKIRTTTPDPGHARAAGRLRRDFTAQWPNATWVADFTHVTAWFGVVYVAFVVDIYSRAIVGWAASLSKHTTLVLDGLDMALSRRERTGHPVRPGLIHHSDAGSRYTSFRFPTHLLAAGIDASIGTVGDALDNALMESQIGLYKTELIKPRGPWHSLADVELATAEWVAWFNTTRLHSAIGHLPPEKLEANHYAEHRPNEAPAINR
ncbi:IS3 family transposase [Nonomuraea sp. NPDC049684]|uniref:IS3 family transposase n=1 Tax=Nonomuraea sp. NPDC049684 TaxID=3364356 RepID=UPI0037AA51BB